ncbi:hypothetical protein [Glycomyces paridis]|uniref:Secreted protein n=1 Tax=Glycomyces paridis TaxID=2126555 RepID=A0A4S8PQ07_9ACTN|nr:hypothetical protein [Glycomyces paridis]THV31895.1 hypothetical protein E9998_00030 [Glycomyces paridis]
MRSIIKTSVSAAAVLVAAILLLMLGTTPAAAADDVSILGYDHKPEDREFNWAKLHGLTDHNRECVDNEYVRACVQPYGDVFWLRDDEWDAIDVRLWWVDLDSKRWGVCQSAEGYGDWARCDKNLTNGHLVKWASSWYEDGEWQFSPVQYITI